MPALPRPSWPVQRGNNGQGSGPTHLSEKNRDDARETLEHESRLSAFLREPPFVHRAAECRPDKTPPTTCTSARTGKQARDTRLCAALSRSAAASAGLVHSKD
ncbi:MAG: hypothetical protein CME61_08180 [Halobacteriovoraceae bacterium]|nr:hypothetical protein [Halobacteriovoraceae bacterium]